MRNCGGDKDKLRSLLDNIKNHYENVHDNRSNTSRCTIDKNYQPSRIILTDPFAKGLLQNTVRDFDVNKHPDSYTFGMSSCLVESFNNTLNIFHDKRVN